MTISDIVEEVYELTGGTDSTSFTAASMLRKMNAAYEKVVGMIMLQDGNWEFDDTNYTDFRRGVTTMVESQNDYSFDSTHLAIESAQVLDNGGIWQGMTPISKDEMGVPLEEFQKDDGLPTYYDKDGKSIWLTPAPTASSVTLANGLKIFFRRTADLFTSAQVTTGTKVPGFASPYHMIIALETAISWNSVYKKDRVPQQKVDVKELWDNLLAFYAKRARDERTVMSPTSISFR